MSIITALPKGFNPSFFNESVSNTEPSLRKEGLTVYVPAFIRQETRDGQTLYRYFDVPVPYSGQPLDSLDNFAIASYANIRKFFYGSQEMQAELRDDFIWEPHRQAVRSAFPKAAGAINELAERFDTVKADFWSTVNAACQAVGKSRADLPASFNAEEMLRFAAQNGMDASTIASYTSRFAIISLNLLQNNRNWDELFPAPEA